MANSNPARRGDALEASEVNSSIQNPGETGGSPIHLSPTMSNIVIQRFMAFLAPVRRAPNAVGSEHSGAIRLNSSWEVHDHIA
jgi:hypothetical protein